jgi:hypothetical protein
MYSDDILVLTEAISLLWSNVTCIIDLYTW